VDASARATQANGTRPTLLRRLRTPLVFLAVFAVLVVLHLTLIELPYYWDEAGYFIPAARDIYTDGSFVPHSTLSNAHPPLVMAYLALAWKLFGFHIAVARVAMLAVSALALTGLFRLAERLQNARVAAATVVCTALYPVFFAQSSLAHLDMMVAALTLWALVFYLPSYAVTTPLRCVTTQLHDDTTPLYDAATQLRSDTTQLRGDTTQLRSDATPSRGRRTQLRDDAIELNDRRTQLNGRRTQLDGRRTQLDDRRTQLDDRPTQSDSRITQLDGLTIELRDRPEPLREDAKALRERAACVALLALAALAKETAVLVPLTLCAWEFVCRVARRRDRFAALVCLESRRRSVWWTLSLLLACVPLALWFAYHRSRTGYTFGNPEYFRYNVESTLNLSRIAEVVQGRLGHVTAHMNLWVLTLAGLAAMFLKPRRDGGMPRASIDVRVQLVFLLLILAHVVALSVVGGAVLARYMLPVVPLVILVWVSTLWRRVPAWPLAVALVCAAFAYRCEVNPSYNFPWEENLAYRDFVLLHRDAARFLSENYAGARVLTSWPATDELRNTYYGYTPRPLAVFPVESLKREDLEPAAAERSRYDAALLYSTHGGLSLDDAVRLLGGRVVFREERKGQWVAVVVGSKR
jgi:4-amino-4-deoxy-L-arabinose transferase-like glycosyltransferase